MSKKSIGIRGLLSRCRQFAKKVKGKWEVNRYDAIRLKHNGKCYCPLTAALKNDLGKNCLIGNYEEAADLIGYEENTHLLVCAADGYKEDDEQIRVRRSLMSLVK